MKPDWSEAPESAMFLAMDGDGYWYWWREEPEWNESDDQWIGDEDNECELADGSPDCSGIDWDFAHSTLECRP